MWILRFKPDGLCPKGVNVSFNLDDFVAQARDAAGQERAVAAVNDLMSRTFANPEEIATAITPFKRDDEPLYEDERVSIYWVRFDPHVRVPPHNHKIAAFLGVYEGVEVNELYRKINGGIELVKSKRMQPGDTLSMGAEGIHGVYSEGDSASLGLHVYLGPLTTVERELFHPDTGEAMPFTNENYEKLVRPLS